VGKSGFDEQEAERTHAQIHPSLLPWGHHEYGKTAACKLKWAIRHGPNPCANPVDHGFGDISVLWDGG